MIPYDVLHYEIIPYASLMTLSNLMKTNTITRLYVTKNIHKIMACYNINTHGVFLLGCKNDVGIPILEYLIKQIYSYTTLKVGLILAVKHNTIKIISHLIKDHSIHVDNDVIDCAVEHDKLNFLKSYIHKFDRDNTVHVIKKSIDCNNIIIVKYVLKHGNIKNYITCDHKTTNYTRLNIIVLY
jgi:hypothetical protein